ncbi:protein RICE SALT SENSITIVE 3-like isoform X2 [Salvia miltiorrhiza]|uniref:protein RICE SALT SENSITIVE 3-like isoform X2 n=1 Tax=Salvia miltiorrhiza TaxID=226208 RepID=UPI0025AD7D2C|nr:protein RICE SALT SENSITIVE 3-like isoform X2 [Salvia miltiorrhiza]
MVGEKVKCRKALKFFYLLHTLRSLCACSDSSPTPSKWVYAVFWRILPRNFPPPKWDHGGGLLDRAKGNKRNWILVWEDGFCDFFECERAGNGFGRRRFGADIFFKMTHEVYNFGEGLVGKVASDNSHKWVFRDTPTENDPTFISSWNVSIDPPRAWEAQFSSGIETIALISVREGAIQLGSFDKVDEDLNMVLNIQRKFSYLQSIPGIYMTQRPNHPIHNPQLDYNTAPRLMQATATLSDKHQMIGFERQNCLGYNNSPQICSAEASPLWSIPPLLPSNLGPFLPKAPSAPLPYYGPQGFVHGDILLNSNSNSITLKSHKLEGVASFDDNIDVVKVEAGGGQEEGVGEEKHSQTMRLEDGVLALGFELHRGAQKCCKS